MELSRAALKRAQRAQALQNIGLPDDLTWDEMTSEEKVAFHSESMRLYHQRKQSQGDDHQDTHAPVKHRSPVTRKIPAPARATPNEVDQPITGGNGLPGWLRICVFLLILFIVMMYFWLYQPAGQQVKPIE
jgi:hypothetical protein